MIHLSAGEFAVSDRVDDVTTLYKVRTRSGKQYDGFVGRSLSVSC